MLLLSTRTTGRDAGESAVPISHRAMSAVSASKWDPFRAQSGGVKVVWVAFESVPVPHT